MPLLLWYISFTAVFVSLVMVMAPTTFMGRNGSRASALAILLLTSTTSLMASFTTQLATTGDVPRLLTVSASDLVASQNRRHHLDVAAAPAPTSHRVPGLVARHVHTASIAN